MIEGVRRVDMTVTDDDTEVIRMTVDQGDNLSMDASDAVPVSTSDYEKLKNRPKINSVTLEGDKKASDLSLQEAMDAILETDIDKMIYGG